MNNRLSIIVAISENGVIGRGGGLPWHLSADLKRFKRLTMGHHIIMGRKTFESMGRPLPGRKSIVISRDSAYHATDVQSAISLENAISLAADDEAFVIGGQAIYQLALPLADRVYLTRVHARVDGDTFFPNIEWNAWKLIESEKHEADQRNDHAMSFEVYDRAT